MTEIDLILEQLDYDEEHKALRVLGFRVTRELMTSIHGLVLTLCFAVGQKLFGFEIF